MILEFPDELERAIRDRPGWDVDGRVATYTSPEGTHVVRVQRLAKPYKRDEEWYATMVVGGVARHGTTAYSAADAVRWAESVRLKE
jgi:hypothetical protein